MEANRKTINWSRNIIFVILCNPNYYKRARQFVGDAIAKKGKAPEDREFRKAAVAYLK